MKWTNCQVETNPGGGKMSCTPVIFAALTHVRCSLVTGFRRAAVRGPSCSARVLFYVEWYPSFPLHHIRIGWKPTCVKYKLRYEGPLRLRKGACVGFIADSSFKHLVSDGLLISQLNLKTLVSLEPDCVGTAAMNTMMSYVTSTNWVIFWSRCGNSLRNNVWPNPTPPAQNCVFSNCSDVGSGEDKRAYAMITQSSSRFRSLRSPD